jgi:hypothetical protein
VHLLLCCAVLCCAVLCCAVLCCAVLCCAVLCCAVLCCAVLCCAVRAVLCCAQVVVEVSHPLLAAVPPQQLLLGVEQSVTLPVCLHVELQHLPVATLASCPANLALSTSPGFCQPSP